MARKIFRTGNSAVVSLPADAMEAVGLELGDKVTVIADLERGCITIAPGTLPGVSPRFLERVDRFIEGYRPSQDTQTGE